jgi:hypothetical protein
MSRHCFELLFVSHDTVTALHCNTAIEAAIPARHRLLHTR